MPVFDQIKYSSEKQTKVQEGERKISLKIDFEGNRVTARHMGKQVPNTNRN